MAFNLRNRSFLKELDFTPEELRYLLKLAAELKAAKYGGYEQPRLRGREIALIFEKTSTRTRTAFETAAHDQGAQVTYLEPSGSQIGHKESMKDTARVLGRTFDGIEYRGSAQENVETLAAYAGVPVWNGLTDEFHPTQILADMLTMQEHCDKPLHDVAFCYLGDARNNMGNSLMVGGCKFGMDVRLCAPEQLWPSEDLVKTCQRDRGGDRGAADADRRRRRGRARRRLPLHRRVGVDGRGPERVGRAYRAAQAVPGERGRDPADRQPEGAFMHCLPAFHNRDTKVGEEIYPAVRAGRAGGHRRGLRVQALHRVRPGREPDAHHQGRARGDAGR